MSFLSELRDAHEPSQTPPQAPSSTDMPDTAAVQGPPAIDRIRTRHPYAKAFACAGVAYLLATALTLGVVLYRLMPQATSPQLGDATAGVMFLYALPALVPALLTGLIVSHATRVWSMWQIALVFLPLFGVAVALQAHHMVVD
jgi:flagellar biosynthesis protein FliQ